MKKSLLKVALGVMLAVVGLSFCRKPPEIAPTLEPDQKVKVVTTKRHVTVLTRSGEKVIMKQKYVPPEGKSEVIVTKTGEVKVHVQTKGLSATPGAGVGVFDSYALPVLDCKWAYLGRFGATAGVGIGRSPFVHPYGAVSYDVYNNSSVFVGYSSRKEIVLGLRISF